MRRNTVATIGRVLQSDALAPLAILTTFIELVLTGKAGDKATEKTDRIATSIDENICASTTNGLWKTPKHLLLGLSLHHLTGSAQIITILNRYGHCCFYPVILELETGMAHQVKCRDSVLSYNISATGNLVANLCWDNFDLNEETTSGLGTTYSTYDILIQKVCA